MTQIVEQIKSCFGVSSQKPVEVTEPSSSSPAEIKAALQDGLHKAMASYADRATFYLAESEPSSDNSGTIRSFNDPKLNYHPFNTLMQNEKDLILAKKTYQILSLVSPQVGDYVKFKHPGVETVVRNRVHPFLPELKPESNLYYVNDSYVWPVEQFDALAKQMSEQGMTVEQLTKDIHKGIADYHAKTLELMIEQGVDTSLEKLNQREGSALDVVLADMRKNTKYN